MSDRACPAIPMLAALVLAGGCAAQGREDAAGPPASPAAKESMPMNADLHAMAQAALADAMRRAAPGAAAPTLLSAERVTWPDGSLGCPMPGRMYTMALVPGYRIRIQSGTEQLDYHASMRGQPQLCPPGRATDPAPRSAVY
jgi:hypothetical protein